MSTELHHLQIMFHAIHAARLAFGDDCDAIKSKVKEVCNTLGVTAQVFEEFFQTISNKLTEMNDSLDSDSLDVSNSKTSSNNSANSAKTEEAKQPEKPPEDVGISLDFM